MLQYKKRKNGNTNHKKEGNLPPNQYLRYTSAKMVTQSYKIGNTERGFARKNGNTEFEKTQKW